MLMELGGNNPTIVCATLPCPTPSTRLSPAPSGSPGRTACRCSVCMSTRPSTRDFLRRTIEATRHLKVGSKMDPDTDIGPLIDEPAARRVEDWVDSAAADGAVIQTGGIRTGAFYEPRSSQMSPKAPRSSPTRYSARS